MKSLWFFPLVLAVASATASSCGEEGENNVTGSRDTGYDADVVTDGGGEIDCFRLMGNVGLEIQDISYSRGWHQCTGDEDCVSVEPKTPCVKLCTGLINGAFVDEYNATVDSVSDRYCTEKAIEKCSEHPTICEDGGIARLCINGICAGGDPRPPDGGIDAGVKYDAGDEDASDAGDADAGIDIGIIDSGHDAGLDGGTDGGADGGGSCPVGVTCVTQFPFGQDRDTSKEPPGAFSSYSCKPTADEGGAEVIYRVTVPADGFLSAAVIEDAGVDVDVHILSELNQSKCLSRGNYDAHADVTAGVYWVVIDTYVSGGIPQEGPFHADIGFVAPSRGPCTMQTGEMARVGDGGDHLAMPATGPVVMEAHLVTQEEPPPYPSTATENLAGHYALSQSATGFVMHRQEQWAPLEGGDFYGCGIGDPADFPVVHEGWYVNMYWTSSARPAKGTRMIFRLPASNRAMVVAAGYETGPGDLSHIGGTPEETHFYLGTSHLSTIQLGIATDQTLPFGPRVCE